MQGKAKWWRARADEAQSHLEIMTDPSAIEAMLAVVEHYKRIPVITEAKEAARAVPGTR